jgi:hypothetical protein
MPLFDLIDRNDRRLRLQNESSFDYLNVSARPGIVAIRELVERWFGRIPVDSQADIGARFRSRNEAQHKGAFFELFWHELLVRSGHQVAIHPAVPNARTSPDFLASSDGIPQFYLEATSAVPPEENQAAERRIAQLHDTLNRMDSPDYFLAIQYRGDPQDNLPGRTLREQLERWLRGLDFGQISDLYNSRRHSEVPSFTWGEPNCSLTFTPIPKSVETRGQPGIRPVGLHAKWEWSQVRTLEDIRVAVEGKANKYGELGLPLVVAVNVLNDFSDDTDTLYAIFGEKPFGDRIPNGAWYGPAGPRNTFVSAVSVVHQLTPTNLRDRSVELIHNPWGAHGLPQNCLALPRRSVRLLDGKFERGDGMSAADILGIPALWPIPD